MAFAAQDWTVTRSDGSIRYIGADHDGTAGDFGGNPGTPSYNTVIEFHRWLQGLADDAVAVGNDELDITNTIPSQRSTDNIITLINNYNIDNNAAEHLYDGSIIQTVGGNNQIYDGIVNFGNANVQIQIIQNGAVIADDWWNYNNVGLNADATSGISHRFMIMTKDTTDIDGRKLIGTCRRFGYTYSEFTINATSRGNNVLALTDSVDLNNAKLIGEVSGWSGDYSNTEGFVALDIDNNPATTEYYYSTWDINTGIHTSINDFYEYTKYLTRAGATAATFYGLPGQLFRGITHEVPYSSLAGGTFIESSSVSWGGASTGTGQILADNGTNKMWIQILTGSAPASTAELSQSAVTAIVGTVVERTISKPFVGASTGSAIIGAYGLGVVAADLRSSDQLTDLGGTLRQPPNNVTNTVSGLVSGEDRVLVAPWDGTSVDSNADKAINKNQLTLTSTLDQPDVLTIQVSNGDETAIPSDTPAVGVIRVTDDNGFERRIPYSSWTGTTFTVNTGDPELGNNNDFNGLTGSGTYKATAANNVYIAYIDKLASGVTATFTSVQNGSRNLVLLVRDGGGTPIKQYIAPWSQTNSNNTTTVIRTSDT